MIRLVKQILIVDLKNNKLFKTHSRLAQAAIFITFGSVIHFSKYDAKMNYNSKYVRVTLQELPPHALSLIAFFYRSTP